MSVQLQVWYHTTLVGALSLNPEGRWSFRYAPGWRAFPLSPHLPMGMEQDDLAHQRAVEWFFDNLLPEGALRLALAKRAGVHENDAWQLLSRFGQDTAGALSVLPLEVIPSEQQAYSLLPLAQLDEMITRSKDGMPLMAQAGKLRMSLAGAQEKIALRLSPDGQFWLAEGATPSTHILKPENLNAQYPFCPANEWFCVSLAASVGLKAPSVHLLNVGEHRVYVIDRYDRIATAAGIRRLHQIDLCQACNVPPARKYEDAFGLTASDLFSVARHCRVPAQAKRAAMSWVIFNYLIGNGDAHAKNISFLLPGEKLEIAPTYDLLCVDAYHHDYHLTMSIAGMSQAGWVEGCHWDAFALQNEIDPRAMRMILKRLADELPAAATKLLVSPVLTSGERDWLRQQVMPVLNERLAFVHAALAEPICRSGMALQAKRGIVPDEVLASIPHA
jgi:serine/threonine-protein kinase HipA